ncbi:MFS transporter [Streptomyces ipomoeae]|uniref:Transporter, major facilitator family protein n=1 Tax=Streptomyces ipomoeae 91-03 TaxID=698759 RepID=L1KN50_9ACTN|nr:MFS transporter [Streptomyces ipomoeae]EKX61788.1 transporter, major facilitator family protein [Streptomyces ipomoeae 91-03]MDX2692251.1 MFS transporter [Streptomyces ipomoeae]MDX2838790.1 MFS transporter [Streptomyces ipomoeae]
MTSVSATAAGWGCPLWGRVITGYALAFGSLLLLGGRLGDLFGRRTTFVTGLIGFAGASVLGGAATSFEILVTARVAQGLLAALLAPAALSLLSVTFTDPTERPKAFGIFSVLSGAGGAVGLLFGGMLTEWASWRWVMYVNVIFAAVALVGALLWLAKPAVTERPKIDIPGTIVVSAALFAIVYGFAHVESTSWTDPVALGSMISGVVLLAVFAWLELRVAHPLLPLRVVLDRTRGGSFLAVFVMGMGMFSIFLFLTYYLEAGIGYSLPGGRHRLLADRGRSGVPADGRGHRRRVDHGAFAAAAQGRPEDRGQRRLPGRRIRHGLAGPAWAGQRLRRRHHARHDPAGSRHRWRDDHRVPGSDRRRAPRGRGRRLGADQHQPAGGWLDQHGAADHRCLIGHDRLPVLAQPRRTDRGAGRGRGLHGHPAVGRRDLRGRCRARGVPDSESGSGALGGRTRDRPLSPNPPWTW